MIVVVDSTSDDQHSAQARALQHEIPLITLVLYSAGVPDITVLHCAGTDRIRRGVVNVTDLIKPWCEQIARFILSKSETDAAAFQSEDGR